MTDSAQFTPDEMQLLLDTIATHIDRLKQVLPTRKDTVNIDRDSRLDACFELRRKILALCKAQSSLR